MTEVQLKCKFDEEFWGNITRQFELRQVTITFKLHEDVQSILNSFFRADSEGFLNEVYKDKLESVTEDFLTEKNLSEFYSLSYLKRFANFFTESATKDILKQHKAFVSYLLEVAAECKNQETKGYSYSIFHRGITRVNQHFEDYSKGINNLKGFTKRYLVYLVVLFTN
jgi:hypothetical protein